MLRVLSKVRRAWKRHFPRLVLPLWVSPGVLWLARNDALSDMLFNRTFELHERAFVAKFVLPGMAVVDVGANAGLYTVIAAKRVGPSGRVIAFEPSPRELGQLRTHLRLNRCANVTIEEVALGEASGQGDLLIIDGHETGSNSFHLADGDAAGARPLRVAIRTLDDYYGQGQLSRIDFIKIDIEGAELSALRGATRVFRELQPVLLCEICRGAHGALALSRAGHHRTGQGLGLRVVCLRGRWAARACPGRPVVLLRELCRLPSTARTRRWC